MLGIVVGMAAEARVAAALHCPVRVGGGKPEGARVATKALISAGCDALLSFGVAGGLAPTVRPGDLIIPCRILHKGQTYEADRTLAQRFGGVTPHTLIAPDDIVADPTAKAALNQETGADAVDLESGVMAEIAAEAGLPFAVVRAICDPADRSMPPAAMVSVTPLGTVSPLRVLASVVRHPHQIGGLIRLARDAAAARASLMRVVRSAAEG